MSDAYYRLLLAELSATRLERMIWKILTLPRQRRFDREA